MDLDAPVQEEQKDSESAKKTDSLIDEVFGEEIKPKPKEEQLVFDFTSAFKSDTKAGKSFKKKKKPVLSSQKGDKENEVPEDATDNVNKDLEDANFLQDDALEYDKETIEAMIPRNLPITQKDMAERKVMDIRRWF